MTATQGFYMVWNEGGRAPTFKHETYKMARAEAERLARNHLGCKFIVLKALTITEKTDLRTESLECTDDDEIPF